MTLSHEDYVKRRDQIVTDYIYPDDYVSQLGFARDTQRFRQAIDQLFLEMVGEREGVDVGRYKDGQDMWGDSWANVHNAPAIARNELKAELRAIIKGNTHVS